MTEEQRRQQQRMLRHVEGESPIAVATSLWELIQLGVKLDPQWRPIWMAQRDRITTDHGFPEEYVAQIDKAVAAIQFIDDAVNKTILRPEDKVCLLLGAGASAPPPSSIPTVMGLLPELWRRARKLGREDIDRLATWCDERRVTSIEDLLTAAYLANFSAKSSGIAGLLNYFLFRERPLDEPPRTRFARPPRMASQVDAASVALFQETLQGLFGLLTSTMIPAKPNKGHQAVVGFIGRHPSSSIVTTNYDGCIDEALMRANMRFATHIAEVASDYPQALDLIKIHGSINWTYCDSCHDVREFDLLAIKDGYERDDVSYAVVGICKKCGGQRRPLLIPPMGLKFVMFPNLIRLWNLARERIESAQYIIVVGFSFSEADSYINKIIERSMSFNHAQIMIVCDPNPDLVRNLRNRYSARIAGFDPNNRVLSVVGSSDELLPRVLASLAPQRARSELANESPV